MTLMAVFYMFVNGWFLIATSYLVGEGTVANTSWQNQLRFYYWLNCFSTDMLWVQQGKIQGDA